MIYKLIAPVRASVFSVALLIPILLLQSGSAQVVFQNNFDQYTTERIYTDDDLDADWNNPVFNNGVTEGRVSVVSGGEAFGGTGSALAVDYPAGVHGTSLTGAQWRLEFGESFEEATLSYRVRFSPGFDFVRGGKLPGLAGGTAPTGSTQATGFNGWTGRMMWRTDFNGTSGEPEQLTSGGITYAKHTTSGFGQDGRQEDRNQWINPDGTNTVLVADRWYTITQRVVMNTPGEFDGVQQIFLDGTLVIDEQNIRYRLTDEFSIDQVYFSTFFGGNDDWRTSKDEVAYFDDFVVTVPGDDPVLDPEPTDGLLLVPSEFPTLASALAAAVDGDTIELSGGLCENVVVDKSVCIIADPADQVVVEAKNLNLATIIVDADNVKLEGFEIDGGHQGVVVRSGNENVILDGLFIRNCRSVGVLVQSNSHGFTALGTEIRDAASDGLRVSASDNISIQNCYWHRNDGHGVRLISCDHAEFTGCRTFRNRLHGYDLAGDGLTLVSNLSLANGLRGFDVDGGSGHFMFDNLAKDNLSHGFALDGVTFATLFDNRSRFNGASGFRVWGGSNDNVLDDNNVTGNGAHGILLGESHGNSIVNSFVYGNFKSGILLTSTTSGNSVFDNVVRMNVDFGIADFGTVNDTSGGNIERDNGR